MKILAFYFMYFAGSALFVLGAVYVLGEVTDDKTITMYVASVLGILFVIALAIITRGEKEE